MSLPLCLRPWCGWQGGGGCRRRMQAGMLLARPKAWSMFSMHARASVCCLGMANAFRNVVGEEGWWLCRKLLSGAGAHNTSYAAKPRPPPHPP
jgi:hypothetical protein